MKLTNTQMQDSVQVLAQARDEKGLLGYALAVNLRKLAGEPALVEYNRERDRLLEHYGRPGEKPGSFDLTPEAAAAFQTALQPFGQIETDVQVMQVAPEIFYGGTLTSGQMYVLAWMAKEG